MVNSALPSPALSRYQAWLRVNWPAALWILTAIVVNAASIKIVPEAYRQSVALLDIPEADRAEMRRSLEQLHLSPALITWFEFFTSAVTSLIHLVIGWLLIRRAPRSPFAGYLAFVLLALSNANYPPSIDDLLPGQPIAQFIIRLNTAVAVSGFFLLPFIFPNGRFVPRWTAAWVLYVTPGVFGFAMLDLEIERQPWVTIDLIGSILLVFSMLFSVIYRYRRVSTPEQRVQTRWVAFGLALGLPGFFLGDAAMRNIGPSPIGIASLIVFLIVMPLAFALPSVTLGIAILHHRLYDIDVILNRTLVWLALTACVTGTYIGVVLGIGSLVGTQSSLLLSLLATGLVAVGFQPLRLRVQRVMNRLLYGDRDDPYAVLARLGHHIEDSLSAADLLPQIVHTTAEALRLPYVALFLEGGNGPALVASSGTASASSVRLPLLYQGATIGTLEVASRGPGEVFSQADRRLLEDLARQIGAAARTVSLAADLQQSRERIVTSREEERRRLRRDLHDGLGPQLAALIMQAGSARRLVRVDPDRAEHELRELGDELRAAVADVRRLVLGLRPPALDELGLSGALRTRLSRFDRGGDEADGADLQVVFEVEEPLPPLSAAVEVAAFRIVEEAVTNVVRHARASTVCVTIMPRADTLVITIRDDGVGFEPAVDRTGLGLHSMQERATELGGTWSAGPGRHGRGSLIEVVLPAGEGSGEDAPWTESAS
jgi:signal transduction histidine kinase